MAEQEIVRKFVSERRMKLLQNEDVGALNEASVFKYVLGKGRTDSWIDGQIFYYCYLRESWSRRAMKVKFYMLSEEYNEEAKKQEVYCKTNNLIRSIGCHNVVTPIFSTHNTKWNRMLVCYPDFTKSFIEWISEYIDDDSAYLPEIYTSLIRDVLASVPHIANLHLSRLGDPASFICAKAPRSGRNGENERETLKLVIFPLPETDSRGGGTRKSFALFLRKNMRQGWIDADVESFLSVLEGNNYLLENVIKHPVLQNGDNIADLIRNCYCPFTFLTPGQKKTLQLTIDINKYGGAAWSKHAESNPIMKALIPTNSFGLHAYDLIWFVKKVVVHYQETLQKMHYLDRTLYGDHPGLMIKKLYPGLVSDLYKLSLDSNYLAEGEFW